MQNLDSLDTSCRAVLLEAAGLVHKAALIGVIVEITREPLKPLAMGNHEAVISVWTARDLSAERERLWKQELERRAAFKPGLALDSGEFVPAQKLNEKICYGPNCVDREHGAVACRSCPHFL